MTDLQTEAAPVADSTLVPENSTSINAGSTPPQIPVEEAPAEPVAPKNLDDVIGKNLDALKKDKGAKDEKPVEAVDEKKDAEKPEEGAKEDAPKPEKKRAPDGKFAKPVGEAAPEGEEVEGEVKPEPRQYRTTTPPEKFNLDAKEVWDNTPKAVRRDIEVMVKEHEAEIAIAREAVEKYDKIRVFDEHARANGWDGAHESLAEMHRLEQGLAQNPLATLDEILQRAGPAKQDGSRYSLYEVAQYVVQQLGPQGMQQTVQQARMAQQEQVQQSAVEQKIQQLEQENRTLQAQTMYSQVFEPFKGEHPRYEELRGAMAGILKSGLVSDKLELRDRLEEAYILAERLYPTSKKAEQAAPSEAAPAPTGELSGSKSIRTTPGNVPDGTKSKLTLDDILKKHIKR